MDLFKMKGHHHARGSDEAAWDAGCVWRDIEECDYPAVAGLNAAFERFLSPMDEVRLAELHRSAAYARVVLHHSSVVAFLIAFREKANYDSPNYVWFDQRYASFLYIDRVVVSAGYQSKGLGRALYADLFRYASEAHIPCVTCEIDRQPPNEPSRRFHAEHGFREVGTQWVAGGRKQVSLQEASVPP